jgi:glycosyltransferase involved in cell wall biosynthesis
MSDEPEFLKILVKESELENEVIFHGSKSRGELYQTFKDFDILVQPSVHEGFGLTTVEGMIAKIPIIISNASGLLEVTNNGEFAQHVVMNNDPEVFYQALVNTIKKFN